MTKPRLIHRQGLLCIEQLQEDHVYRDVLSGYLVLVTELLPEARRARGVLWNPLYGAHQVITVRDRQLINAHAPTDLKPDTRYDDGLRR